MRLSVRLITEMVNVDKETVRQVLHENLNRTKVCAKIVPKTITFEQKELQKKYVLKKSFELFERIV